MCLATWLQKSATFWTTKWPSNLFHLENQDDTIWISKYVLVCREAASWTAQTYAHIPRISVPLLAIHQHYRPCDVAYKNAKIAVWICMCVCVGFDVLMFPLSRSCYFLILSRQCLCGVAWRLGSAVSTLRQGHLQEAAGLSAKDIWTTRSDESSRPHGGQRWGGARGDFHHYHNTDGKEKCREPAYIS